MQFSPFRIVKVDKTVYTVLASIFCFPPNRSHLLFYEKISICVIKSLASRGESNLILKHSMPEVFQTFVKSFARSTTPMALQTRTKAHNMLPIHAHSATIPSV